MRKIKTAEEIEKKQNLIKFIAGGVLVFLMVFSTAGFALNGLGGGNSNSDGLEDVYFDGQYWVYSLGGQQFYFTNRIEDISEIPLEISMKINDFSGKTLYIDSENLAVNGEILNNLGKYAYRIQEACYGECERNLPEKSCEDNFIVFRESEERNVYQEENCIFVDGDLSSVDAFLYKILGFF